MLFLLRGREPLKAMRSRERDLRPRRAASLPRIELTQERYAGVGASIWIGVSVIAVPVTDSPLGQLPHQWPVLVDKVCACVPVEGCKRSCHVRRNLSNILAGEKNHEWNNHASAISARTTGEVGLM